MNNINCLYMRAHNIAKHPKDIWRHLNKQLIQKGYYILENIIINICKIFLILQKV